jgi:hypothetical protein
MASPTRLRRLTSDELRTSIEILLDQAASEALRNLDADSYRPGAFSTSDELVVSESFAAGLDLAAETIASQFAATVTPARYGADCFASDAQAETCATTFVRSFGRRAFRRAITDDDTAALLPVYRAGRELGAAGAAGDRFVNGLSWLVRAMVQSPHFLYRTELGDPTGAGATTVLAPAEVASALSYSVLGMPPDEPLLAAAEGGDLASANQRAAQVARLIAAYPERWRAQMRQLVPQWLGINFSRPEWDKDRSAVPLYSPDLKAALETETALFLDDWATAPDGARVDQLLTTSSTFVNGVNASLYGVSASGDAFNKVALDDGQRAGLLTMAGFLGSTSHVAETSPVLRGKAILERLLCRQTPPPPPMVPPLPAVNRAVPTTTRARFAAHLASPVCSACHQAFEPMGDAFEAYDAVGAYRTTQNGVAIDTSGALITATGDQRPVRDAVALTRLLAESPETYECVSRQVYRFALGRTESDFDACTLARAAEVLAKPPHDLRGLVASLVASDSFVVRTVNR